MQPTENRNVSMDVIRGFAVLGIFLMNIMGFGLPGAAYANPAYYGGASGADLWVWYVQDALFDGRMRGLFAMLFGAGLVLAYERSRQRGAVAAERLAWRHICLAAFGLVHIFLLQCRGDILWPYALCGLVVWVFVTLQARRLLLLALLVLAGQTFLWVEATTGERERYLDGLAIQDRVVAGETANESEQKTLEEWQAEFASCQPGAWPERAEEIVTGMRQPGWLQTFRFQRDELYEAVEITSDFAELVGLMLLGMALGKWGVFFGQRSMRWYVVAALFGFAIAAPIAHGISRLWVADSFSEVPVPSDLVWTVTAIPVRVAVGLAWASTLVVIVRTGAARRLCAGLAATGRMAFSCYLLQSVFATLLFYGYGLARFGQYSRAQLALIALIVWLVLIAFSVFWLRRYRYGPAEWLWRTLSYWSWQPLRLRDGTAQRT